MKKSKLTLIEAVKITLILKKRILTKVFMIYLPITTVLFYLIACYYLDYLTIDFQLDIFLEAFSTVKSSIIFIITIIKLPVIVSYFVGIIENFFIAINTPIQE